MAGMGPPPKDARLRRRGNADRGGRRLPAAGRQGTPPRWPFDTATPTEGRVWAELWATPQAVEWDRLGWTWVVARYGRLLARVAASSEVDDHLAGAHLNELRQLEDRLGLTPMAMLRLRWTVDDDQAPVQNLDTTPAASRQVRAVDPDLLDPPETLAKSGQ
jgi:hypothetical protein